MRRLVLSVVVLGLFALPARAQTSKALEIVPDDALGFILIKDLRQLHDKAGDLATKTNGKAHFAFVEGILSKDLKKGLNEKGSVVVIAMSGKDEKTIPCPILALPVGDHAVLMQALDVKEEAKDGISIGSIDMPLLTRFWFEPKAKPKEPIGAKMPVLVAKRDGFVLLTTVESKDQLQRVLSAKKSIANLVEPARTWLDEQDICGTCTPAGMKVAKDRHRPFATAGESVHQAMERVRSTDPSKQSGTVMMDAFQRAYLEVETRESGLPDPNGIGAQMTLPPLARLALHIKQGVTMNRAAPEKAKKHVAAAQVAALMQILAPESAEWRVALANYLGRIPHVEATRALARLAIFSEEAEVRKAACQALKARDGKDYSDILVEGLSYPWPAVAQGASEAIVELRRMEMIPQLISVLDHPEPGTPKIKELDGKKVFQVRELVRVNHHRNCLLCHAPGNTADIPETAIRAEMPVPGEPFPSHSGYGDRGTTPEFAVRIDVTYLRQDFSRRLKVVDAAPWPEWQRFDFLVRTRTLTDQETKAHRELPQPREPGDLSPYHRAAVVALRGLTGRDTEPTAAAWRKLVARKIK